MFWGVLAAAIAGLHIATGHEKKTLCGFNISELDWIRDCCTVSDEDAVIIQRNTDKGYHVWRLDPFKTAAAYLNNGFIDSEYKCGPVTCCDLTKACEYTYCLIESASGKCMAFELIQPVRKGKCGIYIVTRYAYIEPCSQECVRRCPC